MQAAYTALVALFPAQSAAFEQDLATSLSGIAADAAFENSESIARGRLWGEQVANEILAWRSMDGFNPPQTYVVKPPPYYWQPTPPADLPGMFLLLPPRFPGLFRPLHSRPLGPPTLTSAKYAADFNEEKAIGGCDGTVRTEDQTLAARFWAGTALTFWNRAAASAALQRHTTLSENARLFALLNVAMADAAISCWDSKYRYEQWRPITAINMASAVTPLRRSKRIGNR